MSLKEKTTYISKLKVRYSEVDRQNIVYNSHYLTYYDISLSEMLDSLFDQEEYIKETNNEFHDVPSREDGWFDKDDFLKGASNAYETIVTNFENGNKEALKPLLSSDVMDSFSSVIDDRNNKNESVEFNFIGIEKSEIVHKDLKKNPMEVSVRFISEMITCIKNSKDEVISGSLNQVQKITDVWTFEKNQKSKGSNWLLAATTK